jgi:hypothetical protein
VCIRRIPQLRPGTSARPLFGRDVTQGGENPAQADYGSAITAGVPPHSRRNLATKSRGASSRLSRPVPASGSGVRPRHTWPGLGEVAAGRSPGRRGSGTRGRRPAINCQKFTALCLFKPSRRAILIRPGQNPSAVAGSTRGILGRLSAAVADRPDGWRGRAIRPPGGTGTESPALPSSGRRPACWTRELARSRD